MRAVTTFSILEQRLLAGRYLQINAQRGAGRQHALGTLAAGVEPLVPSVGSADSWRRVLGAERRPTRVSKIKSKLGKENGGPRKNLGLFPPYS